METAKLAVQAVEELRSVRLCGNVSALGCAHGVPDGSRKVKVGGVGLLAHLTRSSLDKCIAEWTKDIPTIQVKPWFADQRSIKIVEAEGDGQTGRYDKDARTEYQASETSFPLPVPYPAVLTLEVQSDRDVNCKSKPDQITQSTM